MTAGSTSLEPTANGIFSRILITGATGGLGRALVRQYARPGVALSLWGRDAGGLAELADACADAGADVTCLSQDLTDIDATLAALVEQDRQAPFDLAIFASGRGDYRAPGELVEDMATVALLGTVNFTAPSAMAAALAARMAKRGEGRIVLVGSAAGHHALPFAMAYAASKAGLAHFAEALRIAVRPHGVSVTLVSPGFIDTAAGRKVPGPKPLLMSADSVAARIAKAAAGGKARVIVPWPFAVLKGFDRLLPVRLRERMLRALAPRP
jgi:short-subunit dehydrogenase